LIDYIIDFPEAARVDRIIPKTKIYEKAGATNRVRNLFVREIEQIRWLYKLSPETVNLKATKSVQEIQVFQLVLKQDLKSDDVLMSIDATIPSPILFILERDEQIRYCACYKRPSLVDQKKWVTSEYFKTAWISSTAKHRSLPVVVSLKALHDHFLRGLIPIEIWDDENIDQLVQRAETLRIKEREFERLEARLQKERQFNRKVEINSELRLISTEIDSLKYTSKANL